MKPQVTGPADETLRDGTPQERSPATPTDALSEVRGKGNHDFALEVHANPAEGAEHAHWWSVSHEDPWIFTEDDIQARRGLHLHVFHPDVGPERVGAYLCWTVRQHYRARSVQSTRSERKISGRIIGFNAGSHPQCGKAGRGYRVDQSVLSKAVQIMEQPQGMTPVIRPVVVGLQTLDKCFSFWLDPPDLMQTATAYWVARSLTPSLSFMEAFAALPTFVPEDRELATLGKIIGERIGMSQCQLVGEEVERRAHIVKALRDHHGKWINGWLGGSASHQAYIARNLRIRLQPFRALVAVDPWLQVGAYPLQVLVRSFEA